MPFDPSDDDGWWPDPWPPQSPPGGGALNPYDWTDPFLNSRTATPNPVTNAPAPFSAAALGAMAWHPPIFLNGSSAGALTDFSASTWPQQPFPPGGPTTPSVWPPQSSLSPFAQLSAADALGWINRPIGLFSRNPGLPRGGLFGSDPDPSSPFAGLPFDPRVLDAVALTNPGPPKAPYTLGMPPRFPPLSQFQSPVETSAPAPDPWSSPAADAAGAPVAPAAAPTRSVLFNHPPAPWDLDALDPDLATLDQAAWNASPSGLPLSKSGQPIFPPQPQLSNSYQQALYAAQLLSPNLVDYFTKEIPPPPPFPVTPGKIPSLDNPYAVPAALEVATWLLPWGRAAGAIEGAAGAVERGVAEAALQTTSPAARGTLPPDALGRINAALRAAVDSGNLTQQELAVLRARAISSNARAADPEGLASPWLPKFDGETTYGVLITKEGKVVPLRSGQPDRFWNYPSGKHVEGKAAVWLRDNSSLGGVVYHNNTTGTCGFCNTQIPKLLPKDARLDVVSPGGAIAKNPQAKTGITEYLGDKTLPKLPTPIKQYDMFRGGDEDSRLSQ
jgi:SCP1.201-like deaminase